MRGVNKVILIGNTGNNAEFKTLNDGTAVAKITLATTEHFRLKSGEAGTKTEWHTVILWRSLAMLVNKYVYKGSLIYVEGKLRYRQYTDKEGDLKYVTEIVAEQILLMDKKVKKLDEDYNGDQVPEF